MGQLVQVNQLTTKTEKHIGAVKEAEKVKDKLTEGLLGRLQEQMKKN